MCYTFTTKFMKAAVGNFLEITFGNNCLKHESSWQQYMKQKEKGLELEYYDYYKWVLRVKKEKEKKNSQQQSTAQRHEKWQKIKLMWKKKKRIQKSKKLFNFSVRLHLFYVL